jgi:hypothetical protein
MRFSVVCEPKVHFDGSQHSSLGDHDVIRAGLAGLKLSQVTEWGKQMGRETGPIFLLSLQTSVVGEIGPVWCHSTSAVNEIGPVC